MSTPRPLTLVLPANPQTLDAVKAATQDHEAKSRVDVTTLLQTRIEDLRRETMRVYGTLEQALFRISAQGVEVKLDDLNLGEDRLSALAAEIEGLQEVLVLLTCSK